MQQLQVEHCAEAQRMRETQNELAAHTHNRLAQNAATQLRKCEQQHCAKRGQLRRTQCEKIRTLRAAQLTADQTVKETVSQLTQLYQRQLVTPSYVSNIKVQLCSNLQSLEDEMKRRVQEHQAEFVALEAQLRHAGVELEEELRKQVATNAGELSLTQAAERAQLASQHETLVEKLRCTIEQVHGTREAERVLREQLQAKQLAMQEIERSARRHWLGPSDGESIGQD